MLLSNNVSFTIEACGHDREVYKVIYWLDKGNYRTWNMWTWDEQQSYDEIEILSVLLDNGQDCVSLMTEQEIEALETLILEHNFDDY